MSERLPGRPGTAQPMEKRRALRIRLYSPIHAEIDGVSAVLIDLSSDGARLELSLPLAVGRIYPLRLTYDTTSVVIDAVVVRCRLDRSVQRDAIVYDAGLAFENLSNEVLRELKRMLRSVIETDLNARHSYSQRNRR